MHDLVMAALSILSVGNTALIVALAFKAGRWMGTVDTRLEHLEKLMNGEAA